MNRSELEERIATNKRNKRESGQQYGEFETGLSNRALQADQALPAGF